MKRTAAALAMHWRRDDWAAAADAKNGVDAPWRNREDDNIALLLSRRRGSQVTSCEHRVGEAV